MAVNLNHHEYKTKSYSRHEFSLNIEHRTPIEDFRLDIGIKIDFHFMDEVINGVRTLNPELDSRLKTDPENRVFHMGAFAFRAAARAGIALTLLEFVFAGKALKGADDEAVSFCRHGTLDVVQVNRHLFFTNPHSP